MKTLVLRALADVDVSEALDYYVDNVPEYALGFLNAIEQAYQHIQQFPASGSLRYAYELNLPELRVWQCERYPYLVFYVEYPAHIEVWRVLHLQRDIPNTLQQEG